MILQILLSSVLSGANPVDKVNLEYELAKSFKKTTLKFIPKYSYRLDNSTDGEFKFETSMEVPVLKNSSAKVVYKNETDNTIEVKLKTTF